MIKDGEYAVWFRTPHGEGTGIVYLANGKISGRDCMFTYSGTYEVDEERFTATLTTKRYAEGPTTVFGVDEVEARLTGVFKGETAVCSGTAPQAPGVHFEANLFPSAEPSPERSARRATTQPGVTRLPQGQTDRHRPAKPFAVG
ncbi:hypothetical protein I6F35_35085 [Bradyrhizobium sp. BRP22]|uniref:hypothetical protein n=1 Tax=Bradyrhizobium sp. BRP22 TaxID=2793821 RepID=UPI001CD7B2EE|nr:hypothetical protein [Bradyrhizobium sp. BRP22]MCA1458346.1 hypothetical protein [Bradyrhizobium sp. BRP22]